LQYLQFIASNVRFLGFGFLLAFCSTFGQTFYIAMYGDQLRATFDLSHGAFGSVYAIGTLSSGLLIIAIGNMIDRIDLRIYAPVLCAAMAFACLGLAVAQNVIMLTVAIFALRICGQGLLSQAATVSMARYFDSTSRGRAVSIAALGFPAGQALLPLASVYLLIWLQWRDAWLLSAALVILLVPVTALWLLRGHGSRHAELLARTSATANTTHGTRGHDWNRAQVLRDPRFYFAMLAMLAPSFIITGLNFHQVHLVQTKGWDLTIYASSFAIYAGCQVGTSVLTGILVDRVGSVRLTPFYMLPLACAALVITAFDSPFAIVAFMALAGVSGGAGATIVSTLWAELYGVVHLGSIKALVAGLAVISSALAPAVFGWLIDRNVNIEVISAACSAYAFAGSLLLAAVFRPRLLRIWR